MSAVGSLALVAATAPAGPRVGGPATSASEIPALASLLEKGGWTPTPEMPGICRAGVIFKAEDQAHSAYEMHREVLRDCFETQPRSFSYTQAEVVSQLQLGGIGNIKPKAGSSSRSTAPRLGRLDAAKNAQFHGCLRANP